MECEQVGLMLEAYALGAVAPEEGAHIEEHLGECLACWDHLSESQRAAALLALAVPLEEPREGLRQRIIAQARRETDPIADFAAPRWRLRFPPVLAVGATAVALAAVGALSWSLVETRNLHSDYHDLQAQADLNEQQVEGTGNLVSFLMRPDVEKQAMVASGVAAGATAYYAWTRDGKLGAVVCRDLPDAPKGKVYQLWLTCGPEPVNGGTFVAWHGECQPPVTLSCASPLSGVAVSVEPEGGSLNPSNDVVLTASFSDR